VIRAVISDFGGVLTNPLFESFKRFTDQRGISFEALGNAMARITERDGENPLFVLERGELTEQMFLARLGDALADEVGEPVEMGSFAQHYFDGLHPNAPMIEWLRHVKADRGLRLALLTNNVREWEPRWRAMVPIDELFETVVDSAFVGMRKPDPRIYALTLERLGLRAQACLFVDDLEHNCVAAAGLGMHTVWFRNAQQAIAELDAALAAAG
jgi:putative hydrolase of the HAD superfamily